MFATSTQQLNQMIGHIFQAINLPTTPCYFSQIITAILGIDE